MKRFIALAMAASLTLAACSPANENPSTEGSGQTETNTADTTQATTSATDTTQAAAPTSTTITDSQGNEFVTPVELNDVIVLNSSAYEMIAVLGKEDIVTGVGDTVEGFGADSKPEFGDYQTPNVEAIIEAQPDAVFGYASWLDSGVADQIEEAGIPIVMVDLFQPSNILDEVEFMGQLLGAEERAEEFITDVETILDDVETRTEDVDKLSAYWEGYTEYTSAGQGSGGDELLQLAGVDNLMGDESTPYPKASDEWVIEQDPQVIVKMVSAREDAFGPGKDETAAAELHEALTARPGWEGVDAVQNDRVILFSDKVGTNPLGMAMVPLFVANMAYPDQFEDVDPDAELARMLEKYWGITEAGTWTYQR